MKEFALKHPWMTFFLADAAIAGVVRIVYACLGYHDNVTTTKTTEKPEEETV